jgi:D-alanyl-D-alanine carboxypeptidase
VGTEVRWTTTRRVAAVALVAGTACSLASAAPDWHHLHQGYPHKPHGYHQIVEVFGQPCTDRTHENAFEWRAADNGQTYVVRYHRQLGGPHSSNLEHDVKGHIAHQGKNRFVRSGIWGYNCRYIEGSNSWSTHAWGIAVDVSSASEPLGQCHSTVNFNHDQIWKDHRWTWGKAWCDPMHFQYASGY